MIGFRRAAQLGSLILFFCFLAAAGKFPGTDLFLRMDPALVAITAIAGRVIQWAFLPALLVLFSAPLFGRVFCGYICPMGTTIDLSDRLSRILMLSPRGKSGSRDSGIRRNDGRGRLLPVKTPNGGVCQLVTLKRISPAPWLSPNLKIHILVILAGAALAGVSLVYWASPVALVTRFYGLVVYPVVLLASDHLLTAVQPIADRFDIRSLMFLDIEARRYAANFFVLFLFAAIFAAARISPRFWCRYLCPAGAILSLVSKRPLVRRQVSAACNGCSKCARNCPMGAIDMVNPATARHADCIACLTCEQSCPQEAIRFSTEHRGNEQLPASPDRRRLLFSGMSGAVFAAAGLTGLTAPEGDEGAVRHSRLIRPPGALPEPEFLNACVRCGQCMAGCPTNTLQPVWFAAGPLGMFSPAVTPRQNFCDPRCTACGNACPTGAIRPLDPKERIWARIGTAVIDQNRCLAWEYKKSCMVCDEVCPFDAVAFEKRPELPFPVPRVDENRCAGCGYCERFCPVRNEAAIVVTPMNALRLIDRSFRETAESRGYRLRLGSKTSTYPDSGGYSPSPGGTAPGFDEGL